MKRLQVMNALCQARINLSAFESSRWQTDDVYRETNDLCQASMEVTIEILSEKLDSMDRDNRVTELLHANNALLERAREAERQLEEIKRTGI